MWVRIDDVRPRAGGACEVSFASRIGAASGTWMSDRDAPIAGGEYAIELTIDVAMIAGETLLFPDERAPSIQQVGARAWLTGAVEAMGDDGVFALRLAPDGLVLLDAADADVELHEGQWIRIAVATRALRIFPYDAP